MRSCPIPLGGGLFGKFGYSLCIHAKVGGDVCVPHGEGEVKPHQLQVAGVFIGDEEGDERNVIHPHPHPYVGICQVYLAEVDWFKTRVGGEHLPEDALERTPKAHHLHGG